MALASGFQTYLPCLGLEGPDLGFESCTDNFFGITVKLNNNLNVINNK